MKKVLLLLLLTVVVFVSCTKEPLFEGGEYVVPGAERVIFDPAAVPYANLSTYRFFKGPMAAQVPVNEVLPYDLITPLFTDYAKKLRFVWMPSGVQAQYNGDHQVLDLPEGSVLIKTFYYDHVQPADQRRIIETRLLFKRNGVWEFADYVWNAEQTEATLDMSGSVTPVTWQDDQGTERSIQYRIPSQAECQTCHRVLSVHSPIGPKPQNLNAPYNYSDGVRNQLQKWVEKGFLAPGYPKNIVSTVAWDDPTQDLERRVRSYLDVNCAHCHSDVGECSYRPIRLDYASSGSPENLGVCVVPDELIAPDQTYLVAAGNVQRSMMHFRMNSTDEAVRMPLIGRTLVHDEGLQLLDEWIQSLTQTCN